MFVRQCALCHTIGEAEPDGVGPNLFAIASRKAPKLDATLQSCASKASTASNDLHPPTRVLMFFVVLYHMNFGSFRLGQERFTECVERLHEFHVLLLGAHSTLPSSAHEARHREASHARCGRSLTVTYSLPWMTTTRSSGKSHG